jgi:hypothetical protein
MSRPPRVWRFDIGHALLFGGVCAVIGIAWRDALAWATFTEPFAAHFPHGRLLLGARMVLLCAALHGAYKARWRGRTTLVFLVVASCFLGTLVVSGTFVPLAGLSLMALMLLPLPAPQALRTVSRLAERPFTLVLAALLGAAAIFPINRFLQPPTQPPVSSPAAETSRWLNLHNTYRARLWARRWAASEADDPGEGALILARIDWAVGRHDLTRATLQTVIHRAKRPQVRELAVVMLARVDAGSAPVEEKGVR